MNQTNNYQEEGFDKSEMREYTQDMKELHEDIQPGVEYIQG